MISPLYKPPEAKFLRLGKVQLVGRSESVESLLLCEPTAATNLWRMCEGQEPPKLVPPAPVPRNLYAQLLLEELLGTKFTFIPRVQGGAEIDLAVERVELQCRA